MNMPISKLRFVGTTASTPPNAPGVPFARAAGLVIVLAAHAIALYGLWLNNLLPTAEQASTLFVNFISNTPPPKAPEPRKPALPVRIDPVERSVPAQLVSQAPVQSPAEYVAPPPPPAPVQTAPVEVPKPVVAPPQQGPATLATELSVACPQRQPPQYPPQARRLGESGVVVLMVELTERGDVHNARVESSSGFTRLDEAALSAVKAWHCNPATRNGQPVRAIAMQPFKFMIQQ